MAWIPKITTPARMYSSSKPEAKREVITIAATEINVLARPLQLMVAIRVQNTLCASLILTLRIRADSDEGPNDASSPYGLGRSGESLATFSREATSA